MARVDAEPGELCADGRDLDRPLRIEPRPSVNPGLDDAVLLELPRERRRDARPLAELAEVDLFLLAGGQRATEPPDPLLAGGSGKLLPDHAERQELVPLQPQDRPQAVDVLVAVEPVAAGRAARREEALILEVPDLGDRDVRKLLAEERADRPDRQRTVVLLGDGGRAHF